MPFMEIPNEIKLRLLLTTDKIVFRKFYWFEMKNEDFYWGSSYKSKRAENALTKIEGTEVTITVPENFNDFPSLSGKYSYHQSGNIHYKSQMESGISVYNKHSKWKLKGEILKPVRFYTMFSRTIRNYEETIKNLTKGKTYAQVLNFNESVIDKRIYFEFFLTPEGTFDIPEPLIKVNKPMTEFIHHTISKGLILLVRFAIMSDMADWHPDKEVVIMPNNLD
jgi:hypothetical protein